MLIEWSKKHADAHTTRPIPRDHDVRVLHENCLQGNVPPHLLRIHQRDLLVLNRHRSQVWCEDHSMALKPTWDKYFSFIRYDTKDDRHDYGKVDRMLGSDNHQVHCVVIWGDCISSGPISTAKLQLNRCIGKIITSWSEISKMGQPTLLAHDAI